MLEVYVRLNVKLPSYSHAPGSRETIIHYWWGWKDYFSNLLIDFYSFSCGHIHIPAHAIATLISISCCR